MGPVSSKQSLCGAETNLMMPAAPRAFDDISAIEAVPAWRLDHFDNASCTKHILMISVSTKQSLRGAETILMMPLRVQDARV